MASSLTLLGFLFVVTITIVSGKPTHLISEEGFRGRGQVRPRLRQQAEEAHMLRAPRTEAEDYEDFPIVPPFLRLSLTDPDGEYFKTPGKRYLGIDIPDYISTGGKTEAIKSMSDKMKAMGKK